MQIDFYFLIDIYELFMNQSGTTGNPKAAMISHDNILNFVELNADMCGIKMFTERFVSFLPLR